MTGNDTLCNFETINFLAINCDVFSSHPQFIEEILLYLRKMAKDGSKNLEVYFHGQCTWWLMNHSSDSQSHKKKGTRLHYGCHNYPCAEDLQTGQSAKDNKSLFTVMKSKSDQHHLRMWMNHAALGPPAFELDFYVAIILLLYILL